MDKDSRGRLANFLEGGDEVCLPGAGGSAHASAVRTENLNFVGHC